MQQLPLWWLRNTHAKHIRHFKRLIYKAKLLYIGVNLKQHHCLPGTGCLPTAESRLCSIPWKNLDFKLICAFIKKIKKKTTKTKAHKYFRPNLRWLPSETISCKCSNLEVSLNYYVPEQCCIVETKTSGCSLLLSISEQRRNKVI